MGQELNSSARDGAGWLTHMVLRWFVQSPRVPTAPTAQVATERGALAAVLPTRPGTQYART